MKSAVNSWQNVIDLVYIHVRHPAFLSHLRLQRQIPLHQLLPTFSDLPFNISLCKLLTPFCHLDCQTLRPTSKVVLQGLEYQSPISFVQAALMFFLIDGNNGNGYLFNPPYRKNIHGNLHLVFARSEKTAILM